MPEECMDTRCKTCAAAAKKKYKTTCIQAAHGGECGGEVAVVNGCFVCKKCGHGATFANERPAYDKLSKTEPLKSMEEAVCAMHNFREFKNEEVTEEATDTTNKRRRL